MMNDKIKIGFSKIAPYYWELITSFLVGEVTDAEKEELKAWLEEDESHRQLYAHLETLTRALKPNAFRNPDVTQKWAEFQTIISDRKARKKKLLVRLYAISTAAVVALLFSIGAYYMFPAKEKMIEPGVRKATLILASGEKIGIGKNNIRIQSDDVTVENDSTEGLIFKNNVAGKNKKAGKNRLVIEKGGEYNVVLADGSKVWLNSESELVFPVSFEGSTRIVELKGEGYFEVAKNAKKPFIVKTRDMNIQVLGTSFNVCSYDDEPVVSTTLLEGSVRVSDGQKRVLSVLRPEQQLSYNKENKEVQLKHVDPALYINWKNGIYSFENTTLDEIFQRMCRWYDFEVEYENDKLRNLRFTGEIDKNRPIKFGLELISITTAVNFEITNGKIKVLKH